MIISLLFQLQNLPVVTALHMAGTEKAVTEGSLSEVLLSIFGGWGVSLLLFHTPYLTLTQGIFSAANFALDEHVGAATPTFQGNTLLKR